MKTSFICYNIAVMNGVNFCQEKYSGQVIYCCLVEEFFLFGPLLLYRFVVVHKRSDDDGIVRTTIKIDTFVHSYVWPENFSNCNLRKYFYTQYEISSFCIRFQHYLKFCIYTKFFLKRNKMRKIS